MVSDDGDEDMLWEVIEIIAEKNKKYRVRWAGIDPATNKPWAPTWVSRNDCTDDLVEAWKEKQAAKKKKGKGAKGGRGGSMASKRSHASASTISKASNTASSNRMRADTLPKVGQKRNRSSTTSSTSEIGSVYASDQDVEVSRPKKRRRYTEELESEEEIYLPPVAVLEKIKPQGRKRPHAPSSSDSCNSDTGDPSEVSLSPSPIPESNGKGKRKVHTTSDDDEEVEDDELDESYKPRFKGRTQTNNARSTNGAPSKASSKQAKQQRKRSLSSSPPLPPAPAPKRRITITKPKQPSPSPSPPPAPVSKRRRIAKEFSSPPPPPAPAPKRKITTKDTSLPQLPIQEALKKRPVDRNKLKRNDTFPGERLSSLSPTSHAQLKLWEEDMKFLDEQQASMSKPVPSRTASKEKVRDPSPSPPPKPVPSRTASKEKVRDPSPSPSPPAAASKRENAARNGLEDSYRREIVPETEPESSNNTQSQSQETQASNPVQPLQPLENGEESRQRNPPETPNAGVAKRQFRREKSLIGKMKPRTPGSVNRTQARWSLYDDDHDSNYQPRSPSLPLYTHNEEPLDLPTIDSSQIEEARPPPKHQEPGPEGGNERPDVAATSPIPKPQFQPIPQISPSKFTPYLPTSSISMDVPRDEEAEVQDLVSSIEQFSSSDEDGGSHKGHRRRRPTTKEKGKGRANDADDEGENDDPFKRRRKPSDHSDREERASELHDRGIELAEQARQERRRNSDPKERNGPLIDLGKIAKKGEEQDSNKGRDQSRSPPAVPQRSPSPMISQELEFSRTQEDMDETGPAVSKDQNPVLALRREEEESTQDLLAEQEAQLPPPPESSPRPMEGVEAPHEDSDMVLESDGDDDETPSGRIRVTAQEPEPVKQEDGEKTGRENAVNPHDAKEDLDKHRPSPPLSPPAPPKQPQKAESPEVPSSSPVHQQGSKSRSGSAIDRSLSRDQSPIVSAPVCMDDAPNNATTSIEASSPIPPSTIPETSEHLTKEIARLEALLSAERAKNTLLQDEVDTLKDTSKNISAPIPIPDDTELRSLRAQLEQQKEEWEQQTRAFTSSIEQLTKSKASAEKDIEFFRDQYARASGFVTSVREENRELEEQAKIASEQAKTGVAMVKATFEHRVKSLEDDVKTWRKLALFAMEKEALTNDDIRRRAAEHPELLRRVDQLEDQIAGFEDLQTALEASFGKVIDENQLQIRELEAENEDWRKEVMGLKAELCDYRSRLEEGSKSSQDEDTSEEMVYRCQWRPEGTNDSCGGVFLSIEELHAHMFSDGHLQQS